MSHEINKKNTSLPSKITTDIKSGRKLAGDDFTGEQLKLWFKQEKEAYYEDDLSNDGSTDPWYEYMRYTNSLLGFENIKNTPLSIVVLGPGPGVEIEEFSRLYPKCKINFIEASENFKVILKEKFTNSEIIEPYYNGSINLEDSSQDIVIAFSVLHHIPNISYVMSEITRVLKPNGLLLIREPCSSMGDWRLPRSATPNERGLAKHFLEEKFKENNLQYVKKPVAIIFEPINTILKKYFKNFKYKPRWIYPFDRFISTLVSFNDYYWRDNIIKKIGPSSYFYIVKKLNEE